MALGDVAGMIVVPALSGIEAGLNRMAERAKGDEAMGLVRAAAYVHERKVSLMDPLAVALVKAGVIPNEQDAHLAARALHREGVRLYPHGLPKIICLVGSMKFQPEFAEQAKREAMEGKITLTHSGFGHLEGTPMADLKGALDELHLRKIDLCDEVMVLNVGGYIGRSTREEIDYATKMQKPVRYLVDPAEGVTRG